MEFANLISDSIKVKAPVKNDNTPKSSDVKSSGSNFSQTLKNVSNNASAKVTDKTDESKTSTVKDVFKKVVGYLKGDVSKEDLQNAIEKLSGEDITAIKNLFKELTEILNDSTKTNKDKCSDIVDLLAQFKKKISDDDTSNGDVLSQIVAMVAQLISPVVDTQPVEKSAEASQTENIVKLNSDNSVGKDMMTIISMLTESKNASKDDNFVVDSNLSELVDNIKSQLQEVVSQADNSQLSQFAQKISELSQMLENKSEVTVENVVKPQVEIKTEDISELMSKGYSQKPADVKEVSKDDDLKSELTELTAASKPQEVEQSQSLTEQIKEVPVNKQIENFIKTEVMPVIKEGKTTEMTMMLNPQELGKISVKIIKTGAEISVSIAAQNSVTSKMIEDKLPLLISNIKGDDNTEVSVKVVTPNQNLTEFMNHFQSENQSQGRNTNHSGYTAESMNSLSAGNGEEIIDTDSTDYVREGKLWQMA